MKTDMVLSISELKKHVNCLSLRKLNKCIQLFAKKVVSYPTVMNSDGPDYHTRMSGGKNELPPFKFIIAVINLNVTDATLFEAL